MNNKALLILTVLTSTSAIAAQDVPDPSDLTAVNTSAFVGMSNTGDVKLSGSVGFGLSNGQMAMGTLEGTMDKSGEYKDSRLQYFHVFNNNSATIPRYAGSVDIIDNDMSTTAAFGGIAMIQPENKATTWFVRGALLGGEYGDDFTKQMGESDSSILGGMAAAYLVLKTGEDGSYIMASPEYTYMGGEIESSILKSTLMYATPLTEDRAKWAQFKIENTSGSFDSSTQNIDINDTVAWAQFKAFF